MHKTELHSIYLISGLFDVKIETENNVGVSCMKTKSHGVTDLHDETRKPKNIFCINYNRQ